MFVLIVFVFVVHSEGGDGLSQIAERLHDFIENVNVFLRVGVVDRQASSETVINKLLDVGDVCLRGLDECLDTHANATCVAVLWYTKQP